MKTRRRIELVVRRPGTWPCPLWRELADSLAWQIDIGRLPPGSRLPSTRTLARELSISRNTVALAYDELASLGYLNARIGDGSYVAGPEARSRLMVFQRVARRCVAPDGTTLMLIRQ